jgi:hypothetical protein
MSVFFERKSLATNTLRNMDICPRAKKPGENGGGGKGQLRAVADLTIQSSSVYGP